MASVAVTNTFSANATAIAGDVNTNFSDLVNYINNRNSASATWDSVSISNASSVPLIVSNSTGTNNIANFRDNATNCLVIADGGATTLTATGATSIALTVNNSTSTGNVVNFQDSGSTVFSIIDGGQTQLADGSSSAPALSFITDPNTGIYRSGADVLRVVAGGTDVMLWNATAATLLTGAVMSVPLGATGAPSYSFNGDLDTGIYSASANRLDFTVGAATTLSVTSGQIIFPTGSVGNPSIAGTLDLDTGIKFPGSNNIDIVTNGATVATFDATSLTPVGGGNINLGTASAYWNDVSYKTLTDRGCLGWFDDGVELQNGTKVPDTEAILAMKKDASKETVYGVPMLDYKTFPKVAYKKAEVNGVLLPRDKDDQPIGGADGIEMTSVFSIMIGAIKELTNRVAVLEKA